MSKKTKIWLIVAASLVLAGGLIFGGAMTMLNWDFSKLSTSKLTETTHTITEEFSGISITTKTADITFLPTEEENATVVCRKFEKETYAVTVRDGSLVIALEQPRKWYDYIGIHFGTTSITVYLPETHYASLVVSSNTGDITLPKAFSFERVDIGLNTGDVKVFAATSDSLKLKTTTGKIQVENVTAGAVELSVNTGHTYLTNIKCQTLTSRGDTGDLAMQNVIVAEKLTIRRDTGDVELDGCDAGEIFIETDTGDVTGTLLSGKIFFAQTDTGKVDVPKSVTGGKCEIETDTGDIKITIQ